MIDRMYLIYILAIVVLSTVACGGNGSEPWRLAVGIPLLPR